MARTETVEFTNMCMICDGSRVVVIDRKNGTGRENNKKAPCGALFCAAKRRKRSTLSAHEAHLRCMKRALRAHEKRMCAARGGTFFMPLRHRGDAVVCGGSRLASL